MIDINLMIVEDDAIIAEDLYSLLTSEGYKVSAVAHNATDAINELASGNIGFAILDIHIGSGPSGIDVAKVIDEKYHIPYIFLTSFDDEETLAAAQSHGPYGYLVKPFQDRSLLTTIKIALSTHRKSKQSNFTNQEQVEEILNQKITDQEYKVILGFVEGKSYKELAEEFHVSINTIKYHAKNIYLKCDVKGRSGLVSKLLG